MGLEKTQSVLNPYRKKILATVLLWCMGLIISIDTWPSLKKMIFLFLALLLVLCYDFEDINRQPTQSKFVLFFFSSATAQCCVGIGKAVRSQWKAFIYKEYLDIQWHAKVLNTMQIVEFFTYYMIDDCQNWSEYSNITGFFTDSRFMNKKYYFFMNSEIFKITLRKSFGHIQFFIDFFVISL